MDVSSAAVIILLVIMSLLTMWFIVSRKGKPKLTASVEISSREAVLVEEGGSPIKRIAIGENGNQPIVIIEAMQSVAEYEKGNPVDIRNTTVARLGSLLQAAPAVMLGGKAAGKHLMEVVINGELARAADGNGLRAFSMGPNGITHHAKLYEVPRLNSVINVAAVWQVASVLVAQKHLADIDMKLNGIKEGMQRISAFLGNQRKARIESTYQYLQQAYSTIQAGEFSNNIRNQLESCECNMLEIESHLEKEYQQCVEKKIEKKTMFGTKQMTSEITNKIDCLDALAEELELCIQTRIAAWHVLSLYPGEPQLKMVRRSSIEDSVKTFQSLAPCEEDIEAEVIAVKSWCKFAKKTIQQKRTTLSERYAASVKALDIKTRQSLDAIQRTSELLKSNDLPTHLLLQFEGNTIVGARQR